jgi:hypothetical protein
MLLAVAWCLALFGLYRVLASKLAGTSTTYVASTAPLRGAARLEPHGPRAGHGASLAHPRGNGCGGRHGR